MKEGWTVLGWPRCNSCEAVVMRLPSESRIASLSNIYVHYIFSVSVAT